MSRRILVILLVAIAAFVFYKQTHKPATAEELRVKAVEDRFTASTARFMGTAAGGLASGLDSAEAAVVEIQKVRAEVNGLLKTLTEDKAIAKATELKSKVDEFCRKNDIN